ncbi:MAG TPA: outer membrane lipoprotein carrier protein LolA [Oligoflexia bacterium]|nr:outer membrane lipoprotein carrier protein LolA [Oligoflexia bacterium]
MFVRIVPVLFFFVTITFSHAGSDENRTTNTKKNHPKSATEKEIGGNKIISEMQSKYRTVRTLSANFVQNQFSAMDAPDHKIIPSVGNIFIERDPKLDLLKFRWQTISPNPALAVSNGRKFWAYTPPFRDGENGQVQIRKASDMKSSTLADLLLANRPLQKSFDIEPLDCKNQNHACFSLVPKKASGDLDRAELHIERRTKLVYKVNLINIVGNRTELELKNIQLNPKLGKALFEFKVPPKTEVIK